MCSVSSEAVVADDITSQEHKWMVSQWHVEYQNPRELGFQTTPLLLTNPDVTPKETSSVSRTCTKSLEKGINPLTRVETLCANH